MTPAALLRGVGAPLDRDGARSRPLRALLAGQLAVAGVQPPWRGRRLVRELYDSGVLSLVIVCISGVAVGAVLGLQGHNTLVRFGAAGQLGAVVGLSLIRELGPVLTSLLVAGRAGSAMAAEIASMKVTEQLDGLRMMSVDPLDFVVAPKATAMILSMPLLATLFTLFGIFGGYLVGVVRARRRPRLLHLHAAGFRALLGGRRRRAAEGAASSACWWR